MTSQGNLVSKSLMLRQLTDPLTQGSQKRGPWAACGPPNAFVRPASISKTENIINFGQIQLIFGNFSCKLWLARAFSDKLRPAKHFFFGMWPSHEFEFETPALTYTHVPIGRSQLYSLIRSNCSNLSSASFEACSLTVSHPMKKHMFYNQLES